MSTPIGSINCSVLAYVSHAVQHLESQSRASLKQKMAQRLAERHQLHYFTDPQEHIAVAEQFDLALNTKAGFRKREHIKRHPSCRSILRQWWVRLSGGAEVLDKDTYFQMGRMIMLQASRLPIASS